MSQLVTLEMFSPLLALIKGCFYSNVVKTREGHLLFHVLGTGPGARSGRHQAGQGAKMGARSATKLSIQAVDSRDGIYSSSILVVPSMHVHSC